MFEQSLSKLACQREPGITSCKNFMHGLIAMDRMMLSWMELMCLYDSNSGNGAFNFYQLNSVVNGIQKKLESRKEPFILLHHRRTKGGPTASSFATRTLNKWMDANSIYTYHTDRIKR